jgi:RNA polymerase sigma-70 factor (ECF subfamily)
MSILMSELVQEIEAIFKTHSRMVYRTAYGVTGSHDDAEDVLQAVFLKLIRQLPPDLGNNPQAYLYRAAVNSSLNIIRGRRRRRENFVDVAEHFETVVPSDSANAELDHRRLYEAIAELKPDVAHIVVLRYMHNKSDVEIAEMLGMSRGAIALKLFRSRARLKKLLRASLGDES